MAFNSEGRFLLPNLIYWQKQAMTSNNRALNGAFYRRTEQSQCIPLNVFMYASVNAQRTHVEISFRRLHKSFFFYPTKPQQR
jgi:hypothetical protein